MLSYGMSGEHLQGFNFLRAPPALFALSQRHHRGIPVRSILFNRPHPLHGQYAHCISGTLLLLQAVKSFAAADAPSAYGH